MRKTMLALYLLGTILLLASASGKTVKTGLFGPPQPPCFPCSEDGGTR